MLKGYNSQWVVAGDERKAVFTNLEPGKYEFFVKLQLGLNDWSKPYSLVKVHISPPFWDTLLFKIFRGQ